MATQAQIDANRRNAQLSTGPKTPEGKATVSRNALKHGLRSDAYRQAYLDPEVYDQILADLIAEHRPQTLTEEVYVERMALCLHKLQDLEGLQLQCWDDTVGVDPATDKALTIYWNQQERLERAFDRALTMLRKLQKERRASEVAMAAPEEQDPAPVMPPTRTEPPRARREAESPRISPPPFERIPEKLAS